MTKTKDVILKLKAVKEEKKLSLDKILSIMEQNGEYVSKTTLSRVFAKGSEEKIFKYENTIRPIANALLDIEHEEKDDDPDTQAYKAILKMKKELISELQEEREKDKNRYLEKLAEETEKFQKSYEFAMQQIAYKDKRIDQLMDDNSKLLNHILDCPYRKECK